MGAPDERRLTRAYEQHHCGFFGTPRGLGLVHRGTDIEQTGEGRDIGAYITRVDVWELTLEAQMEGQSIGPSLAEVIGRSSGGLGRLPR